MGELVRFQDNQMNMAEMCVRSGYFKGIRDIAQAYIKIQIGAELGIPSAASMRGIDIVEGQISIRSHLMAAMIKRSGKYNYRVVKNTDECCSIDFHEAGEIIGTAEFTMDDAKKAGLAGKGPWRQYPKVMLYNRAMALGARQFCPDIFLGGIYYEGEIEGDNTPTPQEELPVLQPRRSGLVAEAVVDEASNTFTGEVDVYQPLDEAAMSEPEEMRQGQRGIMLGFLKRCGVLEGDKRRLLDYMIPEGWTSKDAREAIENLRKAINEGESTLPEIFLYPYVNMLKEQAELTSDDVAEYCKEWFGAKKIRYLDRNEQQQLIAWLAMSAADNEAIGTPKERWIEACHVSDEMLDKMTEEEIAVSIAAWMEKTQ